MTEKLMRFIHAFHALCGLALLASCDIIVPPDPPLESPIVFPDDFVWKQLKINREYEFIGVERIDCPKILSTLTGYGKCVPSKLPIANAVSCTLAYPASLLQIACIDIDDTPAIYAKIHWDKHAETIDFSRPFGPCTIVADGPAAHKKPRFDTDEGYKACLFQTFAPYSSLIGSKHDQRPMGLYVDLSHTTDKTYDDGMIADPPILHSPDALVLDARLLTRDERKLAFHDIFALFDFYASFASSSSITTQNSQKVTNNEQ